MRNTAKILMILLFANCLNAQSINPIEPEVKYQKSIHYTKKDNSGSITITQYIVDEDKLLLVEEIFNNEGEILKELTFRISKLSNCSNGEDLYYQKKIVGQSYLCMNKKKYILIYSFGDKIYEVSALYEETVNKFTKFMLPLSCQLHKSNKCISMFY